MLSSDDLLRARLRHRRRANRFTWIACVVAAIIAVALAFWIASLTEK